MTADDVLVLRGADRPVARYVARPELPARLSPRPYLPPVTTLAGTAFDPRDFYDYRLDPAAAVPALVERFSGPQPRIGQ
jgi:hypothetical protein